MPAFLWVLHILGIYVKLRFGKLLRKKRAAESGGVLFLLPEPNRRFVIGVREVSNILHDTIDKDHISVLIELRKGGHTDTDRGTFRSPEMKYPVFHKLLFLQLIQEPKTRGRI